MTAVLANATCDEQRDFAASLWLRWSRMGVGRGAGVTLKSYTGRVLASAEEGLTGPTVPLPVAGSSAADSATLEGELPTGPARSTRGSADRSLARRRGHTWLADPLLQFTG